MNIEEPDQIVIEMWDMTGRMVKYRRFQQNRVFIFQENEETLKNIELTLEGIHTPIFFIKTMKTMKTRISGALTGFQRRWGP